MTERSIAAYDISERVKTYDADTELMHPNRSKMVDVALEVLPFPKTAALQAVDLESVLVISLSDSLAIFRTVAFSVLTELRP